MNRSTILKITIPLLFALAILFGLSHKSPDFSGLFGMHSATYKNSANLLDKDLSYYNTAQELAKHSAPPRQTATFLAAGDIMLSHNVAEEIKKTGDPLLPFAKMSDILKSTNFNFANLESPVAPKSPVIGGHSMVFAAPAENIQGLKDYNFSIVNLANNHSFDQGLAGINATKKALDDLGILHEGTGNSLDEAWQPAIVLANGIKICFVGASFSSVNDGGKTKNNYVARIDDLGRLKSAILDAKSKCSFTVATMHAGTEYTRKPNPSQTAFAHAAIDYGADLVIGAHPHWVQTIEKYNGRWIFYSLGNFIFDQEWSKETKEGLPLKIQISKNQESTLQGPATSAKVDSIELMPVILENYSTPRPANDEETKKILEKIGQDQNILN